MRSILPSVRWLPPLLVGAATATTAEIGAGVLLYSGPGMLRSLTTVLVVECASLGLGLWSAPPRGAPGLADALRRRWLLYLVSILAATVFSGVWSLIPHFGHTALEQGVGLALLGALPLYACGTLLGAMGAHSPGDGAGRTARVAPPAMAGATVGFALTGLSLSHVLMPASLLLTALALVAAGGLVHGALLDAEARADKAAAGSPSADEVAGADPADEPPGEA